MVTELFDRYVEKQGEADVLRHELFKAEPSSLVTVLRHAINERGGTARLYAFQLLEQLPEQIKCELFAELLGYAIFQNGNQARALYMLLALPREWLGEKLENSAEKIIGASTNNYGDAWGFLSLCESFDTALALRWALRASQSTNSNVRDAGEYFVGNLNR